MPIACTSEPKDRTAPCAAPAAACLRFGIRFALRLAADASAPSEALISVIQPSVRRFSAAHAGLKDTSRTSGRVRCSPGLFRHRKGGGTSPHLREKTLNSGQNTSQRTRLENTRLLIRSGEGRPSAAAGSHPGRGPCAPDLRSRSPPGLGDHPRAPPFASRSPGPANLILDGP